MKKDSAKYKISPRGKRKLDFPQKQKKSNVKLPLVGKTVFLDVMELKHQKRLSSDLKKLGATIEQFVSRDINYFITRQSRPKAKAHRDDGPAPSPFNCDPSPSPGNLDEPKVPTVTRGKALAEKARVNSRENNSLLDNAEKWGVRIVSMESAFKWIEKELRKLPKHSHSIEKETRKLKCVAQYKFLDAPYLKLESSNIHYRPIYQHLSDVWPTLDVYTPRGSCPFDGQLMRGEDKSKEERGELAAQVDIPSEDTPQEEKDGVDSNTPRPLTEKSTKRSETEGPSSCKIMTAGELRRKKELKRKQEKRKGYCECCKIKYEDLDKHVREESHRVYVKEKSNYHPLDSLIGSVQTTAEFLKQRILSSVTETNQQDPRNKKDVSLKSPSKSKTSKHSPRGTISLAKHAIKEAISQKVSPARKKVDRVKEGGQSSNKEHDSPVSTEAKHLDKRSEETKENKLFVPRKSPRKSIQERIGSPRKAVPNSPIKSLSSQTRSPFKSSTTLKEPSEKPTLPLSPLKLTSLDKAPSRSCTTLSSQKSPLKSNLRSTVLKSPTKSFQNVQKVSLDMDDNVRHSPRKTNNPFKTNQEEQCGSSGQVIISQRKNTYQTSKLETEDIVNEKVTTDSNATESLDKSHSDSDNYISNENERLTRVDENPIKNMSKDLLKDKLKKESKKSSNNTCNKPLNDVVTSGQRQTKLNKSVSGSASDTKQEVGHVQKELESLLNYGKKRANRSGSSDDFEVSFVRTLGEVQKNVDNVDKTDKEASDFKEDICEDPISSSSEVQFKDRAKYNYTGHEDDFVNDKIEFVETEEYDEVKPVEDSASHKRSHKNSSQRKDENDDVPQRKDSEVSERSCTASKRDDEGINSDIPSDFQTLGPEGQLFAFSKTLAERIKERGKRRGSGSVENYNLNLISQNAMRARTDSFSSNASSGASKTETKVKLQKKRKSPIQNNKDPKTSVLVASQRICNKYRNKRTTNHNEQQVGPLSGYHGDDEGDIQMKAPTKRAPRKAFWYYEVESDGSSTTCDEEKLKSLPKELRHLQTAWNDITESSDNDSTRKLRRSVVGGSEDKLESNTSPLTVSRKVFEKQRSAAKVKNERGSFRKSHGKRVEPEIRDRRHLSRTSIGEISVSDNSDSNLRTRNHIACNKKSETSGVAASRNNSRVSYKSYFQQGDTSDNNEQSSNVEMESASGNDSDCAEGSDNGVEGEVNIDSDETDSEIVFNNKTGKKYSERKKTFWDYVVEPDNTSEDEDDLNIPKELRHLKSKWNKLTDMKNAELGRRSRSGFVSPSIEDSSDCNEKAKKIPENRISKLTKVEKTVKCEQDSYTGDKTNHTKKALSKKGSKFWEYIVETESEEDEESMDENIPKELRCLKTMWNKLMDVKNADARRRSRSSVANIGDSEDIRELSKDRSQAKSKVQENKVNAGGDEDIRELSKDKGQAKNKVVNQKMCIKQSHEVKSPKICNKGIPDGEYKVPKREQKCELVPDHDADNLKQEDSCEVKSKSKKAAGKKFWEYIVETESEDEQESMDENIPKELRDLKGMWNRLMDVKNMDSRRRSRSSVPTYREITPDSSRERHQLKDKVVNQDINVEKQKTCSEGNDDFNGKRRSKTFSINDKKQPLEDVKMTSKDDKKQALEGVKTTSKDDKKQPLEGVKTTSKDDKKQPLEGMKTTSKDDKKQPLEGVKMTSKDDKKQPLEGVKTTSKDDKKQPLEGVKTTSKDDKKQPLEDVKTTSKNDKKQPLEGVKTTSKDDKKQSLEGVKTTSKDDKKQPLEDVKMTSKDDKKQPLEDVKTTSKDDKKQPLEDVKMTSKDDKKQPLEDVKTTSKDDKKQPLEDVKTTSKDDKNQPLEDVKTTSKDDKKQPLEDVKTTSKDDKKQPLEDVKMTSKDDKKQALEDVKTTSKDDKKQPLEGVKTTSKDDKDVEDGESMEFEDTSEILKPERTNKQESSKKKSASCKFWEYVIETECEDEDSNNENIPKELRELKSTWNKSLDVKNADARRSRSSSAYVGDKEVRELSKDRSQAKNKVRKNEINAGDCEVIRELSIDRSQAKIKVRENDVNAAKHESDQIDPKTSSKTVFDQDSECRLSKDLKKVNNVEELEDNQDVTKPVKQVEGDEMKSKKSAGNKFWEYVVETESEDEEVVDESLPLEIRKLTQSWNTLRKLKSSSKHKTPASASTDSGKTADNMGSTENEAGMDTDIAANTGIIQENCEARSVSTEQSKNKGKCVTEGKGTEELVNKVDVKSEQDKKPKGKIKKREKYWEYLPVSPDKDKTANTKTDKSECRELKSLHDSLSQLLEMGNSPREERKKFLRNYEELQTKCNRVMDKSSGSNDENGQCLSRPKPKFKKPNAGKRIKKKSEKMFEEIPFYTPEKSKQEGSRADQRTDLDDANTEKADKEKIQKPNKKTKFWEYIPVTSPDKTREIVETGVHRELKGLKDSWTEVSNSSPAETSGGLSKRRIRAETLQSVGSEGNRNNKRNEESVKNDEEENMSVDEPSPETEIHGDDGVKKCGTQNSSEKSPIKSHNNEKTISVPRNDDVMIVDVRSSSPVFRKSPAPKKTPNPPCVKVASPFCDMSKNKNVQTSYKTSSEAMESSSTFTTPEKSAGRKISTPQSGYSTSPREKRRKQWKRKLASQDFDNKSSPNVQQPKRRKLENLKYRIDEMDVSSQSKVTMSPQKSLHSPHKQATQKAKQLALVSDVNTHNPACGRCQQNVSECKCTCTETKGNTDNDCSLKWQPVTLNSSTCEHTKKVKLNKSWTLISDRSASRLLSSDDDDKDSFNGFTEDDVEKGQDLPSDVSYEEHSEVYINSSEHEWSVESEHSDNDQEFAKFVPSFSSPGKPSEPDWELNIDSFMKNKVSEKNQSCLSVTSPWRSPRRSTKKPETSVTEKVTPVKNNKRQSFLNRITQAADAEGADREVVDEEIEFNHRSPQKFRCDFSPLRAEHGVIFGQVRKNATSTPSGHSKSKKKLDKNFSGLVFSLNDEVNTDSGSSIQSPNQDYRILKKKSDVKKTFSLKYDASPQKKQKKHKT